MTIPTQLDGATVCWFLEAPSLGVAETATGREKPICALAVGRYSDSMFHVFALSADGVVLGDLAFASEVEAMHQAEEFYDAPSGAWQRVS